MIESLSLKKADRNEITFVNDLVEALNGRLKHVSIVVAELAKALCPSQASSSFKSGENINTKLMRRDFMRRQAEIVK
jgi:hypothetical protein